MRVGNKIQITKAHLPDHFHPSCWQDNHVEADEELPKKTILFFAHATDIWDAEFYAKVNDDVYVNIG